MPFSNLEAILPFIAANIDHIVVQTLVNNGQSQNGQLLASVNTQVVKVGADYQLQTHMLGGGRQLFRGKVDIVPASLYPVITSISKELQTAVHDDMEALVNPLFTNK